MSLESPGSFLRMQLDRYILPNQLLGRMWWLEASSPSSTIRVFRHSAWSSSSDTTMAAGSILPSSSPAVLCSECSGIVFDDVEGDAPDAMHWERKDTYPDLPLFRKSAAAGCTFCEYLCFVLEEKLPKPLQIALQKSTAADVVVKLSSPAYVMRSDIIDVTRDWMPDDYGIEQDGIYWLDFRFESEAWRKGPWSDGWKARAIAYQGDDGVCPLAVSTTSCKAKRPGGIC